jgi:hypothetical protein
VGILDGFADRRSDGGRRVVCREEEVMHRAFDAEGKARRNRVLRRAIIMRSMRRIEQRRG